MSLWLFLGLELWIILILDSRTSANWYRFLQVWQGSVINIRFLEAEIVIAESKTVFLFSEVQIDVFQQLLELRKVSPA